MRALMARVRGPEGVFLGKIWKTQLLLLMVVVIGTSVESSEKGESSDKSEKTGLTVVAHTSGETREKRAGIKMKLSF